MFLLALQVNFVIRIYCVPLTEVIWPIAFVGVAAVEAGFAVVPAEILAQICRTIRGAATTSSDPFDFLL